MKAYSYLAKPFEKSLMLQPAKLKRELEKPQVHCFVFVNTLLSRSFIMINGSSGLYASWHGRSYSSSYDTRHLPIMKWTCSAMMIRDKKQICFLLVNFINWDFNLVITDHVHSTREGNVFRGVCPSVHRGGRGIHPDRVLSIQVCLGRGWSGYVLTIWVP